MDDDGHGRGAVELPATAPAFFFEELAEILPTCIAYEDSDTFWWNLGYFHDHLHAALEDNVEPLQKFSQNIKKKLSIDAVAQHLGVAIYMKPNYERTG